MEHLPGKNNYLNYDSHFAPVVPNDPKDPKERVYLPLSEEGQQPMYDEIVVFQGAAALIRIFN